MTDLNQQTLKNKVVEILSEGCFIVTETRFNHGNLKQAFSFASTGDRWFKMKFQSHKNSKEFVIGVGFIPDMEPVGHIGFNLNENGKSINLGASFGINKEEWLERLLTAKYNPIMTDKFRREFESLPEDSVFKWEVSPRRRV